LDRGRGAVNVPEVLNDAEYTASEYQRLFGYRSFLADSLPHRKGRCASQHFDPPDFRIGSKARITALQQR
jgi:hypothetical protein